MKIEIDLKIFLVIIVFFLLRKIDTYLIFVIFIVLHEIAHLITGLIFGGVLKRISLNPLGVSLELYLYNRKKLKTIVYIISGPILNFILSIIFLQTNMENTLKLKIVYTNLILCFFNLLPILPLDGGNLLKELFKIFFDSLKANQLTIYISKISLFIISFLYACIIIEVKNIFIVIVLIYLWYLYFKEEKRYNLFKRTAESIINLEKK